MHTNTRSAPVAHAVGIPVERVVGRPAEQREERGAHCFAAGCNGCDECTDYDDRDTEPEGCEECAWGKVLGCWRCGGWGL